MTHDDLRAVAKFAGIPTDTWPPANGCRKWKHKTAKQLKAELLSDSGMAAILRAALREAEPKKYPRDWFMQNFMEDVILGVLDGSDLNHAVLGAAVQYVREKK